MGKKEAKTQNKSTVSFKDSVKTKLIALMAALVVIPLLIAILVSYTTSTTKAKSDALDILAANANFVESEFSGIIENNIIGLQAFAAAPSTITYLNTYGAEDAAIPDSAIITQMKVLDEGLADGSQCVLSLATGDQVVRSGEGSLSSIADRDYFQDCKATLAPVTSNILTSKATGDRIMIICVPVLDDQTGAFLGTVQRSIELSYFHDILAENVNDGYIADRTGIVAAHA